MKLIIFATMFTGSLLGGYIPTLWGAGVFSFAGIIGNFIGGSVGIYVGFKIGSSLLE